MLAPALVPSLMALIIATTIAGLWVGNHLAK
jgi:hypothetical protein